MINHKLSKAAHIVSVLDAVQPANAIYIAEISGNLEQQELKVALKRLQEKYSILQSKVILKKGKLQWEEVDWKNTAIDLHIVSDKEASKVGSNELDVTFEIGDYPLIRCHAFTSETLISKITITVCHSISDGIGGIKMLTDLLNFTQPIQKEKRLTEPRIPNIDGLYPKKHSGLKGRINAFKNMASAKQQKVAVPNFKPALYSQRDIGIEKVTLNAAISKRLLNECRQKGTTITGAITAAYLVTMRTAFSNEEPILLSLPTAIDLRNKLDPALDEKTVEMLNGNLTCTLEVAKDAAFWNLAKQSKAVIAQQMAKEEHFTCWNVFPPRFLTSSGILGKGFLTKFIKSVPPITGGISNIGVIDESEIQNNTFEVNAMSFSVYGTLPVPFYMAVSSFRDELTVNISYSKKMMEATTITTFLNQFKENILKSIASYAQPELVS